MYGYASVKKRESLDLNIIETNQIFMVSLERFTWHQTIVRFILQSIYFTYLHFRVK